MFSEAGDVERQVISSLIAAELGDEAATIAELPAGANSKVFAASGSKGRYLVKQYRPAPPGERSDRLHTEFSALSFLWDHGIRRIPRPLGHDRQNRLGIYQFLAGRRLASEEITANHLDQVAAFLLELHQLRLVPSATQQPLASEACLSLAHYREIVNRRLDRLLALPQQNQLERGLRNHLQDGVIPMLRLAETLFRDQVASLAQDPNGVLPVGKRTLSPSDLGFQNILLAANGDLFFVDFEYFGWDDPAKMIADFYLQPAVPLPEGLRASFLGKLELLTANDALLPHRLAIAYLFSALKWSLLVLNCFVNSPTDGERCRTKLDLSRRILQNLADEIRCKKFPLDRI